MRAIIVTLILSGCCFRSAGQGTLTSPFEGITRRVWKMQSGLLDHVVTAIAETPDHYLWLGTPRNLIRFDGFHFVDVSARIAPAIRDFGVTCLFTADDGSLWIGTGGGKLLRVKGNAVKAYGASQGLGSFNVVALQQDASRTIWAGTDHGIYRLVQGQFQRVQHIGDPSVHSMISDGDGGLWIGGHRLIHYAKGHFQDVPLPRQKLSLRIEALARTSDGTLWIGTLGGLFRMSSDGSISPIPIIPQEIKTLLVDRDHKLWAGTLDGGLFLRVSDSKFDRFAGATEGLSSTVLALSCDESDDIWLGTESGLARLSHTGMRVIAIPAARRVECASVALDTDGSLWIGTGKAVHFAKGSLITRTIPLADGAPIRAILRDAAGNLWIGTAGEGAIRIPRIGKPEKYSAQIGTSYITGFIQAKNGDVWIATESGLAVWRSGAIVSFQRIDGAPHRPVLSLASAGPQGVWAGTSHGLFLLRNGRFVADPAIDALGDHAVRALLTNSDGTLWIGTEAGLFRWKDHQMVKVPLENDGGSPAVLSILENPQGELWLGGPERVRRVSCVAIDRVLRARKEMGGNREDVVAPVTYAVLKETGAALYGGRPSSSAPDGHDGAWFVGDLGLVHVSGSPWMPEGAPTIVLQNIVVDGREEAIPANGTIFLPPSTKTLEIETTPIVLGSHAGLRVRRKLIGFDRSWSTLPGSHIATYTNLPPGKYVYRVEASWQNGRAQSAELKIVQRAYFYSQWWFLILCAAGIASAIWWMHRQRVNQLAARFHAVGEERNRVAREMHDTILQGCIGISFLLDGIVSNDHAQHEKNDAQATLPEQSRSALDLARREIERTISDARTAIWNLRHSRSEATLERALRELFSTMTSALPFPATFQANGLPLQVRPEQQDEILMAVREALQNSIRHADAQSIAVSLHYAVDGLRIEVADQGRGMPREVSAQEPDRHFGITGMRERMGRIGGVCHIKSIEGSGTTVVLDLPADSLQRGANLG